MSLTKINSLTRPPKSSPNVKLIKTIWYGVGWNFIIWGTVHGIYLTINHIWRTLLGLFGIVEFKNKYATGFFLVTTFVAVSVGWVIFRAEDMPTALRILKAMFGMSSASIYTDYNSHLAVFLITAKPLNVGSVLQNIFSIELPQYYDMVLGLGMKFIFLFFVVWCLPNVYQFFQLYPPALDNHLAENIVKGDSSRKQVISNSPFAEFYYKLLIWKPEIRFAVAIFILLLFALSFMTRSEKFIYFQF